MRTPSWGRLASGASRLSLTTRSCVSAVRSTRAPLLHKQTRRATRGAPHPHFKRFRRLTASTRATELSSAIGKESRVDVKGKKFALISVSDKTGLMDLAQGLVELGYDLTSTGGSARAIQEQKIDVTRVEDLTQFPEMLDGRVKTLHPAIHGGILARRDDPAHVDTVDRFGIPSIEIVVVNLYPFRQTVLSTPPPSFEAGVEKIDIGGPAMIRAAAKNHEHVYVIIDPGDYSELLEALKFDAAGDSQRQFRKRLAWKAFQHCATYDALVSEWLWSQLGNEAPPSDMTVPLHRIQCLRYGENPHQKASFYMDQSLHKHELGGTAAAHQHHGKEMSYNNYLDADAAFKCVCDLRQSSCVIVKHTNPCGAASREDLSEAYQLAVRSDPISAFGGVVAFNREVDQDVAQCIKDFRSPTDGETKMFLEVIIAPSYTPEALEILRSKSKNLRILETKVKSRAIGTLRQVAGGFLLQQEDALTPDEITFTSVSEVQPTEEQLEDLKFAWTCVKHVKSNAITVAKNRQLLGMGSGQPNRVKSVDISLEKAKDEIKGAVLASDAFFPFSWGDAVEKACQAGVVAIAHPGGSVRDSDAIDCCNKYGVALMTTGIRHFTH